MHACCTSSANTSHTSPAHFSHKWTSSVTYRVHALHKKQHSSQYVSIVVNKLLLLAVHYRATGQPSPVINHSTLLSQVTRCVVLLWSREASHNYNLLNPPSSQSAFQHFATHSLPSSNSMSVSVSIKHAMSSMLTGWPLSRLCEMSRQFPVVFITCLSTKTTNFPDISVTGDKLRTFEAFHTSGQPVFQQTPSIASDTTKNREKVRWCAWEETAQAKSTASKTKRNFTCRIALKKQVLPRFVRPYATRISILLKHTNTYDERYYMPIMT